MFDSLFDFTVDTTFSEAPMLVFRENSKNIYLRSFQKPVNFKGFSSALERAFKKFNKSTNSPVWFVETLDIF